MRTSPLVMALIYTVLGIVITYAAISTVQETIWNFWTMLLIFIATYDFIVAIRFFKLNHIKKRQKK